MVISKRIQVVRGDEPAELLLKNAHVINVFFGEMKTDSKNMI